MTPATQPHPLTGRYSADKLDAARKRLTWLKRWQAERKVRPAAEALTVVAAEAKRLDKMVFKRATLYRWERQFNRYGLEGLIPRHRGPQRSDEPTRSPEAIEYFIEKYRNQSKPSLTVIHRLTLREAKKQGWAWPPSYQATHKWWTRPGSDPNTGKTYCAREGETRHGKRLDPYLKLDDTEIQPGGVLQLDHTPCDFFCMYKGKAIRPWLTAAIDFKSRVIVGHRLSPQPHSGTIRATLHQAFRDWAIPDVVHFDRGKDFLSEIVTGYTKAKERRLRKEHGPDWREWAALNEERHWRGTLQELGIELKKALPYRARSKGRIERVFSTFKDQYCKTHLTYTGNKPENRPDIHKHVMKQAELVPAFEDCARSVAEWIELYNRRPHHGDGMNGQSPFEVFSTAESVRRADEAALECLMETVGAYTVGANGVSIKIGNRTVGYGATSACLNPYRGHKVLVRLNPDDVSQVVVYTADRHTRIGRLASNPRIPFGADAETTREALREIEQARKQMRETPAARRKSQQTLNQAVASMNTEELRERRATGTDGRPGNATIRPVRTGFEAVSTVPETAFDGRSEREVEPPPLPDVTMDDLGGDDEDHVDTGVFQVTLADFADEDDE